MKKQKGVALVVSVSILLVGSLLALSSYQSSQLEERMAANHRFSVASLQAAEAGVNEMLDSVLSFGYTPGVEFCDNIGTALSGTGFSPESGWYEKSGDFSGGGLVKSYKAAMACNSSGHVVGFSRGKVVDADSAEVAARRVRVEIIPPGNESVWKMLAEGDIRVTGNSTIIGNVHSNSDVTISLKSTGKEKLVSSGYISAHESINVSGAGDSVNGECLDSICAQGGSPKQSVPLASDTIYAARDSYLEVVDGNWVPKAGFEDIITVLPGEVKNRKGVQEYVCDVSASSLNDHDPNGNYDGVIGGGYIYYCPGNTIMGGDFQGYTVMSELDFVHNGNVTVQSDEEIDTYVLAGRHIELNGSSESGTWAAFHSDGDFQQNGNSKIYGAIVAGGSIGSQGGIVFEARDPDKIFVQVSGRMEGWVELEDPSTDAELTDY